MFAVVVVVGLFFVGLTVVRSGVGLAAIGAVVVAVVFGRVVVFGGRASSRM